jgi:tetratricopeptide (TPR) repeat protein
VIVACLVVSPLVIAGIFAWHSVSTAPEAIGKLDPKWLDPDNALQAEAVTLADRIVRDFPDDVEALFIRGLILNKFISRDVAAQCWQECIRRNPGFGEAHYWVGKEWFKNGDYEKALDSFRKAVDLKAPISDVRIQLADALTNAGRPGDAVPVLEEQVRVAPRDVAGWFYLGHANALLGKLDAADAAYRRAVELNPGCHQAWHGLAMTSQKRGDADKAREYLQKFQTGQAKFFSSHQTAKRGADDGDTLERTLATAYTDAGRLYSARGDAKTGEECWLRAGEIDSDHADSRIRLLDLYGQQRRPQAALRVLEQLCRIQPENPNHSKNLEAIRRMLGQDGQ